MSDTPQVPHAASVLIVEDDWPVAVAVQRQLTRAGLRVLEPTSDGADAIRRVGREHPDLVLVDISLAGEIDGLQQNRDRLAGSFQHAAIFNHHRQRPFTATNFRWQKHSQF